MRVFVAWFTTCLLLSGAYAADQSADDMAGSPVAASAEPVSQLAGAWFATAREFEITMTGTTGRADRAGLTAEDRYLVVAVKQDGTFDWTRSWLGVAHGVFDLVHVGDTCQGRRPDTGPFEVTTAEYSTARSSITIKRNAPPSRIAYPWNEISMTIEAASGGRASVWFETDRVGHGHHGKEAHEPYKLAVERPTDWQPAAEQVRSEIAGSWSLPGDDLLLVIIRGDGTFDWSGTVEGHIQHWLQLERTGDGSLHEIMGWQKYAVESAEYVPSASRLNIRGTEAPPGGVERSIRYDLTAEAAGEKLRFNIQTTRDNGRVDTASVTLVRNNKAVQRHEGLLSTVEQNGGR